jgi:CHAT domain-containing protein/Flp pilus assembly protein TadD
MSEEHGKSVQEWVNQGIEQTEAGDHESALISFTKVLELEPNHVETRYRQAATFSHLNRIEEAIAAYQACYQSATEAKNFWYQAAAQYSLGLRYKSLQNSGESAQAYAQAYRLFRQIKDEKWTEAAWKELTQFTDNYMAVNQHAEAIPLYQIQQNILQEFNDQKVLCSVLENLGKAQYYQNDYQSAIESHTLMLEIARFEQNKVKESLALAWLGCDHWQANQLDFALHYFQQRLTLAKTENDSAAQKETLGWLVSVCKQLGKDTAMPCPYMMEQIELFRQLGETDKERSSCYELGSWQFDLKQYQEGVESFTLAANLGKEINKANAYFMLGQCYQMLEQQAEALKNYQKATDLYIQHDNQEWAAKALDYLGQIYKSLKEYEKAIEAQQQRLKLVQAMGDYFNEFAINYELGCLYNKNQHYSNAIEHLTSALIVAKILQHKGNEANANYMLGETYSNKVKIDEAIEYYRHAESLYNDTGNKRWSDKSQEKWNRLYFVMVEIYLELKNYPAAIEYADRSKTRNLVELLATRDLYPKGNIPKTVLTELDRLRHELNTELHQIEITEENHNLERRLIPDILEGQNSPTFPTPDRTRLNQLRQELDEFIKHHIAPHDPNFALTQKVEPILFSEIQQLVSDGKTALIEWYIYGKKFLVFIVTYSNPIPRVWQSSYDDLKALMKWASSYLNCYYNTHQQWRASLDKKLEELAAILHINEILNLIPSECEKLILIPHRYLHLFPLHALKGFRTQESGFKGFRVQKSGFRRQKLPLIDLFPGGVRYAPSCQLLQITSRNAGTDTELQHLVAIQNPTDDLTFTDIEVETIRHYFDSADILAKQDATKEALRHQVTQNSDITPQHLHFSCHGYYNLKMPLLSALLLAGCKISSLPPAQDPNRYLILQDNSARDLTKCLTLGELFDRGFDLRHCRLVTLSACETGLSDFSSLSDEYISLPSGFIYAGVPSLVCTLWAVSDLATAFLMIKFYENLKTHSVPVALKNAQIWMRDVTQGDFIKWINLLNLDEQRKKVIHRWLRLGGEKPFRKPQYWAAFCAVGQ